MSDSFPPMAEKSVRPHGSTIAASALQTATSAAAPLLLLAYGAAAGSLTGAGIGMGALTMHGQTATVTQTTETTNVHKALNVAGDFATQVAFHLVVLFEFLTDLVNFVSGEVVNATLPVNAGGIQNFHGRGTANAINVGERNVHPFAARQINTCYSRHN
ncbi:hypothetical protein KM92DES2_10682 [uncultured Desulfovibrio sp.]|uniref:Uncharacterized protein n=1 Tax=uncultured Desulfovibrio sp. TaxID=167968 RepID=A0A212J831_9BACT|nr:hypothetical protein KM92DES2_10682 [uncultured Desulfovibrio sp.]